MNKEQKDEFIKRINSITQEDMPAFGVMNVNQMIAHCADQFRMAFGEVPGLYRQNVDLKKLMEMSARGESLPTVDGLDQELGQGTKPTTLENDKSILIDYIEEYFNTPDDYQFHFHPFIGDMDKEKWNRLVERHLSHHLKQFGR
jgi:hypothetical protein